VLGDLNVKIKEITNEGLISSFAKGLLPEPIQKVIDTPYRTPAYQSPVELAKIAAKQYGAAPNPALEKLPKQFQFLGYLQPYEFGQLLPSLPKEALVTLPPEILSRVPPEILKKHGISLPTTP
jgi:hypothetical protein